MIMMAMVTMMMMLMRMLIVMMMTMLVHDDRTMPMTAIMTMTAIIS